MSEFDYLGAVVDSSTDFEKIPDGKYKCKLDTIVIDEKAWGKDLTIKWLVTEGQFAKRIIWQNMNIPAPSENGTEKYTYAIKALSQCSKKLNPACKTLGEFLDVSTHAQYLDKEAIITIKTNNKGYQNVFIDKVAATTTEVIDPFA